jgi:hypothetical protein
LQGGPFPEKSNLSSVPFRSRFPLDHVRIPDDVSTVGLTQMRCAAVPVHPSAIHHNNHRPVA